MPHNPLPAKHSNDTRTVQLRVALTELTQSFPAIQEIYLFGSRRHGSTSFRSDIDLLARPGDWLGLGVATQIWEIDRYLDVFVADGGTAVSLANGSRIEAPNFEGLVAKLDAAPVWTNGDWCGTERFELHSVLRDAGPTYTNVHPTYLDGAPLLVMCALPEEFTAMIERLGTTETAPTYFAEGGATVAIGSVNSAGEKVVVAVSLLPRIGNVSAAMATLDAIDSVRPSRAVLAGIAAGLPGETQMGDIVVPQIIVGYEEVKLTDGAEAFHGSMPETKPEIIAQIKGWPGADAWSEAWTVNRDTVESATHHERPSGPVRLLFDAMASGEKVIASAHRAAALTAFNRKVISLDMEAFGFSAACTRRGIPFIVVKSISDLADDNKSDDFHSYCCAAAADLIAELVIGGIL